jgi:hypothetical protein
MASLRNRLRSRDPQTRRAALREAVTQGAEGEAALVDVLGSVGEIHDEIVVIALGNARGEAGPAALHRVLRRSNASLGVLRAALLALAKRCGVAASPELMGGLESEDEGVRKAAILGFAGVGDDRAWELVFARLEQRLHHPTRRIENPHRDLMAFCYLARHVGETGCERSTRLVGLIRDRWNHLDDEERHWLAKYWPESRPGGPAPESVQPPDGEVIAEWVRTTQFRSEIEKYYLML